MEAADTDTTRQNPAHPVAPIRSLAHDARLRMASRLERSLFYDLLLATLGLADHAQHGGPAPSIPAVEGRSIAWTLGFLTRAPDDPPDVDAQVEAWLAGLVRAGLVRLEPHRVVLPVAVELLSSAPRQSPENGPREPEPTPPGTPAPNPQAPPPEPPRHRPVKRRDDVVEGYAVNRGTLRAARSYFTHRASKPRKPWTDVPATVTWEAWLASEAGHTWLANVGERVLGGVAATPGVLPQQTTPVAATTSTGVATVAATPRNDPQHPGNTPQHPPLPHTPSPSRGNCSESAQSVCARVLPLQSRGVATAATTPSGATPRAAATGGGAATEPRPPLDLYGDELIGLLRLRAREHSAKILVADSTNPRVTADLDGVLCELFRRHGWKRAVYETVGDFIGANGLHWRDVHLSASELRKAGVLERLCEEALRWANEGRPEIRPRRAAPRGPVRAVDASNPADAAVPDHF